LKTDTESAGNLELWVYILECENGALYTGYTTDLLARYESHVSGTTGAKFTRSFKPRRIAQSWRMNTTTGTALRIEHMIKKLSRARKLALVNDPSLLSGLISERLDFEVPTLEHG
jgi:putative endonuclease